MPPTTQKPELNPEQIKQYNTYRSEGMTPERALMLATKDSNNQYNPALEHGVDNILFGKGSFTEAVGRGIKNAALSGFQTVYKDTQDYGAGFALLKSPLSVVAGVGRGVGDVVGGALETADDLTGEVVSDFLKPYVESAVNSDVGQYLLQQAVELDQKGRGIPGDILDSLNLVGIGAIAKSGTATGIRDAVLRTAKEALDGSKNLADDAVRAGGGLSSFIPKGGSVVDNAVDTVIEGGVRTLDAIKKVPETLSEGAKRSIDRRIVRIATENPEKATETILDLYKRGVVPGVKKKNKTIANIQGIDEAVKRAVPDLAKKYDVEDLEDFANAIGAEKKAIFAKIEEGLVQAGDEGRAISTEPILKELDALLESERAQLSTPLRNAIEKAKRELSESNEDGSVVVPRTITPSGAQDVIADLNAQLQSYYRGSTPGTNADVIVDTLVVNNLRKAVDDVVEDLGEGSFKELKARYGDLKKMEDDVVHRAVFEAQKGGGLADLTDILSAGDIAAGAINPLFLAKGAAQFLTKEVIKSLSDKNEIIRQMFLYGKNLP